MLEIIIQYKCWFQVIKVGSRSVSLMAIQEYHEENNHIFPFTADLAIITVQKYVGQMTRKTSWQYHSSSIYSSITDLYINKVQECVNKITKIIGQFHKKI